MQIKNNLLGQIEHHIYELSVNIGERPTGSVANHRAENYIKEIFAKNGFQTELQAFNCIDWEKNKATLTLGGTEVSVEPSPYSLPCDIQADVEAIETIAQLERADLAGKIVMLSGELTQEPLMPKNFRFYNPAHHQKIISLLEGKKPAAILTTSLTDNHFIPVLEDGDFDIPSAIFFAPDKDVIAQRNLPAHLKIESRRKQATGANVIAKKNQAGRNKFVVTAHFDTKPGTPGALDNAVGVTVLLTLSEMLKDAIPVDASLELVAFNGEDYFSTPGQTTYLDTYSGAFKQIKLAANCDGLGLRNSKTGLSFIACPEDYVDHIESINQSFRTIEKLSPWYQGDHMLFASAQVPTLAITSTGIFEIMDDVIHTQNDQLSLIEPELVGEVCLFLQEIINSRKFTDFTPNHG